MKSCTVCTVLIYGAMIAIASFVFFSFRLSHGGRRSSRA
jgi:hypothetical protein